MSKGTLSSHSPIGPTLRGVLALAGYFGSGAPLGRPPLRDDPVEWTHYGPSVALRYAVVKDLLGPYGDG